MTSLAMLLSKHLVTPNTTVGQVPKGEEAVMRCGCRVRVIGDFNLDFVSTDMVRLCDTCPEDTWKGHVLEWWPCFYDPFVTALKESFA